MKKKKNRKRRKQKVVNLDVLEQIRQNAAGIDIGDEEIWVSVPEDRDKEPVRCFETFTRDLHELTYWLIQCGIKTVAMESTGIYWIPLFDILENNGIEVFLVNPRHVKNIAGKKDDIEDCQWLRQLHTYGLLRASFVPEKHIRPVRELSRQRDMLIESRARHIQHMQQALHKMNLQLDNVITDITGQTGMKIMRAIVAGNCDPKILAGYRDPNCKNSRETIEKSLEGFYSAEQVFKLKQAIDLYDYYGRMITECDRKTEEYLKKIPAKVNPDEKPLPSSKKTNSHCKNAPDYDLRSQLYRLSGVDLTAIDGLNASTVFTILSETGVDMSKWETEKHFASWLCLCPNNKRSGGKILSTRTRKTKSRANRALRQGARSLHRSPTYLGAYFRRMRVRLGAAKAVTATAHKLACIIYKMLKEQIEYVDAGEDFYLKKNREREIKRLNKRANALGFYITPIK
jgi:transposase